MKLKSLIVLFSLTALMGCGTSEKSEPIRTGTYFDLVELLNEQVQILEQQQAELTKALSVNGENETVTLALDSAEQWKKELELFYQADINRLGLEDAYTTKELQAGDGRRKVTDTANNEKPAVRVIEYDYVGGNIVQIRIVIRDNNTVYDLEKELLLKFSTQNGKNRLSSFSIEGDQKMVLKKALNYTLHATVSYAL